MSSPTKQSRRLGLIIALAIIGTLGGLGYAKVVRPNIVPKNFGVVEPGLLYRSGELTPAATRKVVEQDHIKTIIDLGAYSDDPAAERVAAQTAQALSVNRRVFRLEGDGTGNPNAYVEALRIITDPANQPVLVHCSAGSQRTGACILLYKYVVHNRASTCTTDLLAELAQYGHDPKRNTRLRPYLDEWADKIAAAYKAGTLIEGQSKAEITGK